MSEAKRVPLVDQLARIPIDARMTYEHGPTEHSLIPVGVLAHRAAAQLHAVDRLVRAARNTGNPRIPLSVAVGQVQAALADLDGEEQT